MPIYEYRCEGGHEFETYQRLGEAPVKKCTSCDRAVRRLISASGHLRLWNGSGVWMFDRAGRSRDWES